MKREVDLVRAELVDALRDYADVFHEKAGMETERALAVEAVASKIESGGAADTGDTADSKEWVFRWHLLEMRFFELQARVNRLILEHGNN